MKLNNITLAQLMLLEPTEAYLYTYSFKYGVALRKAHNHLKFKPIREYTFGQVKDCQQAFDSEIKFSEIPKILALFESDEEVYFKTGVFEVFQQFAWVKKQIHEISEIERNTLVRRLTEKEMRADVSRFEDFGVYPQLRAIALAFHQTIDWARNLPYNEAFLELYYQKTLAEFEGDFSKLK